MKRDMELMRKILFAIEEQYEPGSVVLRGLQIPNYDMKIVAEHCDLLYQEGLIKNYKPIIGNDTILKFIVGNITNRGYEYLEIIRNEEVWGKTKTEIEKNDLPTTFETIAKVAGTFIGNVIKELNG